VEGRPQGEGAGACNGVGRACRLHRRRWWRRSAPVSASLADRGYQLLTATGAVIEAARRHCTRAVLLVHEFAPPAPPAKLAQDLADARADLDAFVRVLSGDTAAHVAPATVAGAFALHPTTYVPAGVQLYVAKAVTIL
jgi:hypothetical protein